MDKKIYMLISADIWNDYFVDADCDMVSTNKEAVIDEAVHRYCRHTKRTEEQGRSDLVIRADTDKYFSCYVGKYFVFGREVEA